MSFIGKILQRGLGTLRSAKVCTFNTRQKLLPSVLQVSQRSDRFATTETGQHEQDPRTKVLYDGECPLCIVEINFFKTYLNKDNNLNFVDITKGEYRPEDHMGVTFQEAMDNMHVIGSDKKIHKKMDGIRAMYRGAGLGWLVSFTELPGVRQGSDKAYEIFAANRHRLTGRNRDECVNNRCGVKTDKQSTTQGDKV